MSPATYTQSNSPMSVSTPLGKDVLLLVGFSGNEAISQPYGFQLDLLAKSDATVAFDKLLGQNITVTMALPEGGKRYFNGICSRFSQGMRDARFTAFRMEIVPQLWLLTRRAQSRTYQQLSVPEILNKALQGVDVRFELQGTYEHRDYCVQYRETDFNFVSRLMEEEGIYYFFEHSDGSHKMVVADTPQSHPDMPERSTVEFEQVNAGHLRDQDRIYEWEKAQELRAGKYALWDHSFELPGKNLEAKQPTLETVNVGAVSHKLKVGGNDELEIYDYPGEYAQRFDGIDPSGGDRANDINHIFTDNTRTVGIRMQQEALPALVVRGASGCRQWTSGYKFTLAEHFDGDGQYVLASVHHAAVLSDSYRSGADHSFQYANKFTCIPVALPFRTPRVTPKPLVYGTQTAVVVGTAGEEIFTDKYGRVKVQFPWDRIGQNDADSSCWIRVGSIWAGKQWGGIHIPRVGQEVIVAFEEGDPDRPIIVGSVYNAEQMPPYTLPDNKTQSGLKTRSSLQGSSDNFNELRFEDKKNSEEIYFHAEKDFNRVVENNDTLEVGSENADDGSQTITIWKDRTETVKTGNELVTIEQGNRTINVNQGNDEHNVKQGHQTLNVNQGNRTVNVDQGNDEHNVKQGNRTVNVNTGNDEHNVKTGNRTVNVNTGNDSHNVQQGNRSVVIDMGNDSLTLQQGNQTTKLNLGASSTEAMQSITLKVGQNSITIDQTGVTIKGMMVTVEGQVQTQVKGVMTQIQGSAMTQISGGITMIG